MSGLIKFVAAVGLALGLGAVTAYADPTAPAKSFTIEQVGEMLKSLGIDAQPVKDDNGAVLAFAGKRQVGNWTLPVVIFLSNNGQMIHLMYNLGKIEDPRSVPTEAIQKLMKLNSTYDLIRFGINQHNVVNAKLAFNSSSVTGPAVLKALLEEFEKVLEKTEELWHPDTLGQLQPAPKGPQS